MKKYKWTVNGMKEVDVVRQNQAQSCYISLMDFLTFVSELKNYTGTDSDTNSEIELDEKDGN